ncbi:MAG: DUF2855 family protein [Actinomycetota bacterium]
MSEENNANAATDLIIDKADHGSAWLIDSLPADVEVADGQILVEVQRFALTTNNMSYARAGDFLGYWNFYLAPDPAHGRLPVWGFGRVARSAHAEIEEGEEMFGCFTIATRVILEPGDVSDFAFSEASERRSELHPWYNRFYRTAADPVTQAGFRDTQPVLWALFMTGWELANEVVDNHTGDGSGVGTVIIASASSKTAWSMAHSLQGAGLQVVGLTSPGNQTFTESLGCYDSVVAYDDFDPTSVDGDAVLVDMAGNQSVAKAVHEGLGDRLMDSITVGATHRGAGAVEGALAGPPRRFFFIPTVAETKTAEVGHTAYHQGFAEAWASFAPWAGAHLRIEERSGADAMLAAYLAMEGGQTDPTLAQLFTY